MSQGLRPHHHEEYIGRSEQYYNKKKHLLVKKEQKICNCQMLCTTTKKSKYKGCKQVTK